MLKEFHLLPSRFSTVHSMKVPAVTGSVAVVNGSRFIMSASAPVVGFVEVAAEYESITVEQVSTPNTPVASNTIGSEEEDREER